MIIYSVITVIVFGAFVYKERYQVGVDPLVVPLTLLLSVLWPLTALAWLFEKFTKALAGFFIKVVK